MTELGDARYVSLTTYKRDGTPVATPVWIARSEHGYLFTTGDKTWKARRLHRDPRVRVQVSDVRGRVKPDTPTYAGTGVVKDDAASVVAATAAIHDKYGWQFQATTVVDRVRRMLHLGEPQEVVAVELTLDPIP